MWAHIYWKTFTFGLNVILLRLGQFKNVFSPSQLGYTGIGLENWDRIKIDIKIIKGGCQNKVEEKF